MKRAPGFLIFIFCCAVASIGGAGDLSSALDLPANLPSAIPTVQLVAPLRGTVFDKQEVPIAAEASDVDGYIRQVDFYAGTNLIGSDFTEPFGMTWRDAPLGKHALSAMAFDNNYHRGISLPVHIQVGTNSPTRVVRGPYLQSATTNAITICYRTDWYIQGCVAYGTNESTLDSLAIDPEERTEHAIRLTGLEPDTTYYYAIYADTNTVLRSGTNLYFRTPPATNRSTRIWVIGDSGTGNTNAANVRDAYVAYSTNRSADLWLMLGDNAYEVGSDAEYQRAVFNMYTNQLPNLVLWPTLGNHDAASSGAGSEFPYLDIFTLPTSGECGGVSSGTEKYYSFDFANIHFVCLDSQSSSRLPGSPMLQWLEQDLAATSKDWIIAFWHHPPYSWGTHNSDNEFQLVEMRRYVVPVLEDYGVDLTLCGHSHNYERSFFIHGHHGTSGNLESPMILDSGSGDDAIDRAYEKPAGGLGANQGSVFAVCGCSGEGGVFEITRHPAMRVALTGFGSMVIDVDGDRLEARFIRDTGEVDDRFTIVKSANPRGARPALVLQRDADKARLRWPASRVSFSLEQATSPVGPWSKITDQPTTLGRWHYLLRNPEEGNRLFRLRED
jgi:hypothetical protein